MWELIRCGAAQPLLPGHFPVPVRWIKHWWYVPDDQATGPLAAADVVFYPAPLVAAARFSHLAARVGAAPSTPR
jgi:hypothetical protein